MTPRVPLAWHLIKTCLFCFCYSSAGNNMCGRIFAETKVQRENFLITNVNFGMKKKLLRTSNWFLDFSNKNATKTGMCNNIEIEKNIEIEIAISRKYWNWREIGIAEIIYSLLRLKSELRIFIPNIEIDIDIATFYYGYWYWNHYCRLFFQILKLRLILPTNVFKIDIEIDIAKIRAYWNWYWNWETQISHPYPYKICHSD